MKNLNLNEQLEDGVFVTFTKSQAFVPSKNCVNLDIIISVSLVKNM